MASSFQEFIQQALLAQRTAPTVVAPTTPPTTPASSSSARANPPPPVAAPPAADMAAMDPLAAMAAMRDPSVDPRLAAVAYPALYINRHPVGLGRSIRNNRPSQSTQGQPPFGGGEPAAPTPTPSAPPPPPPPSDGTPSPLDVSSFDWAGPIHSAGAAEFITLWADRPYRGATNPWHSGDLPKSWELKIGMGNYNATTDAVDVQIVYDYKAGIHVTGSDVLCYPSVSRGIGAGTDPLLASKGSKLPARISNLKRLDVAVKECWVSGEVRGVSHFALDLFVMASGHTTDVRDGPFKISEVMSQVINTSGYATPDWSPLGNNQPPATDRTGWQSGMNQNQFVERITIPGMGVADVFCGPALPFTWFWNDSDPWAPRWDGNPTAFIPGKSYFRGERFASHNNSIVWTCVRAGAAGDTHPVLPIEDPAERWRSIDAKQAVKSGNAEFLPTWSLWANSWDFVRFMRTQHPKNGSILMPCAFFAEYMLERGWNTPDDVWAGVELGVEVSQQSPTNPYATQPNPCAYGSGTGMPVKRQMTDDESGANGQAATYNVRGLSITEELKTPEVLPTARRMDLLPPKSYLPYLHATGDAYKYADGSPIVINKTKSNGRVAFE